MKDFVPLAALDQIVFGAWDPIPDDAYTAAKKAGVLEDRDLEPVADFARHQADARGVRQPLRDTHQRRERQEGKTKRELAEQLRQDMRDFKAKNGCDRLVIVWCASTEIFIKARPAARAIAAFEKAMDDNDEMISPAMLYAWAAIMEGSRTATARESRVDRKRAAARDRQRRPDLGEGFQDRADVDEDRDRAGTPGAHARPRRLVFDEHPRQPRRRGARRSGLVQDEGRVEAERAPHDPAARAVPRSLQRFLARRAINYYPPRG
jgi:hypothetical protein